MVANSLTMVRFIIAPLFAYVFAHSFRAHNPLAWQYTALAILGLIELSDAFDGYCARKLGEVSDFGKLFDPMADSVSRLTVFTGFLISGILPLWMFLIFLYRDSIVTVIRYMCLRKGLVVAARLSGKVKAIMQAAGSFCVLAVCLLHGHGVRAIPPLILGRHPGYFIMLVPALFTAYSAFDYWFGNRAVFDGSFTQRKDPS